MKLEIIRDTFADDYTLGKLVIDGVQQGFTCEDAVRGEGDPKTVAQWKIDGMSAIPYGRYRCGVEYSNRFKRVMPTIFSVPGFKGIRIHAGNRHTDTEGCPLIGLERTKDGVRNCAPLVDYVCDEILKAEKAKKEVFIEIRKA